ncbi:class I SAM-dependent methyltransferase [Nocardia noduli]|uniref:class I SAM-dependent methyltransferase n=1 Tax=Nocardia noduli TaxID=2815722 RepID=UPI001C24B7B4|nr:class I SAM-dependent methyltransferase [Nocardia noduli]
MNKNHLTYLASPAWAEDLRVDLLPWLQTIADLGEDVLEIGPGPGLTTDLLRECAAAVTAVEVDTELAAALAVRLAGSNVEVIHGDATRLAIPDDRFSAATCFSMLHHMPSPHAQDELFAEVHRVLRPGGVFLGVDTIDSPRMRQAHLDDTFVPADPATLPRRLAAAGFTAITVGMAAEYPTRGDQFRFSATKSG